MNKKRGAKKKCSAETVKRIRYFYYHTSCSISQIARHFDISSGTVDRIINKKGAYDDHQIYINKKRS